MDKTAMRSGRCARTMDCDGEGEKEEEKDMEKNVQR